MDGKRLYIEDFSDILSRRNSGHIKVICPLCVENRTNKRDKSLSIDCEKLVYNCHHCGAKGILVSKYEDYRRAMRGSNEVKKKEFIRPTKKVVVSDDGYPSSFVEYFKGRGISVETLKKCKVTKESEWMPQTGKKTACIAFNYFLKDELINVKYRTRDKGFKLITGAELIPYNIDSIHPSMYKDDEEKSAIFVEGEMDALTYIECGYTHVISCPNGAKGEMKYIDDFIEDYFDALDYIYVSVDNDKCGIEMREELFRRFGKEKCRLVNYPEPCKDINEVLVKYGKDEVKKCLESYIELKPEGIMEVQDVEDELDYLFNNGYQAGVKVGDKVLDRLVSFKTGLLTIVTGVPSHGKTFALNYILTKLNILHDWKVAFFSPEFYPVHEHIGQIMETFGGKRFRKENYSFAEYDAMKDYVRSNFFWIDPNDTEISSVIDRARYLIKKRGIKALVIDPFNALTDKKRGNQKKDEYISDFLQDLRHFARQYGVAVFLVMHPTKLAKLENGLYPVCDLYNCKGASEVNDKADIGITVWRNKERDYCEIHIVKIKFRHLGQLGFSTFKFNINNGRYVEVKSEEELRRDDGVDIQTMEVKWDNSNYILDKLESKIKPQEMDFSNPINNFTSDEFDNPFEGEELEDLPF